MGVIHGEVVKALSGAIEAVVKEGRDQAAAVRAMKRDVSHIARELEMEGFQRLPGRKNGGVLGYVREVALLEILDGVFKVARRIARSELQSQEVPDRTE